MPKHMNGFHSRSTERRDMISNKAKDQELRTNSSRERSNSNIDVSRSLAAVRASSSKTL